MPATYLATGLENAATNLATHHESLPTDRAVYWISDGLRNLPSAFRWEPEAKLPGSAKLWARRGHDSVYRLWNLLKREGDRLALVRHNFQIMNHRDAAPRSSTQ